MKKKIFFSILALFTVICSALGFVACGKGGDENSDGKNNGDISGGADVEITGTFYTLSEAYNNGWLTQDDLKVIASYHSDGKQYPESIGEDVANAIKKDWAKERVESGNSSDKDLTAEKVIILKYYGTYNECTVVRMDRKDAMYIAKYNQYTIEVGGVTFSYNNPGPPQITVWKV